MSIGRSFVSRLEFASDSLAVLPCNEHTTGSRLPEVHQDLQVLELKPLQAGQGVQLRALRAGVEESAGLGLHTPVLPILVQGPVQERRELQVRTWPIGASHRSQGCEAQRDGAHEDPDRQTLPLHDEPRGITPEDHAVPGATRPGAAAARPAATRTFAFGSHGDGVLHSQPEHRSLRAQRAGKPPEPLRLCDSCASNDLSCTEPGSYWSYSREGYQWTAFTV